MFLCTYQKNKNKQDEQLLLNGWKGPELMPQFFLFVTAKDEVDATSMTSVGNFLLTKCWNVFLSVHTAVIFVQPLLL